jgi:hypothetical protein
MQWQRTGDAVKYEISNLPEKHDSLPEVVRSLRQNFAYPHPNSQIPVAPETFSYLGSAS